MELNSETEISSISKLSLQDAQGNGQFTTDSQGRKRTSGGGDPRTGKFHQRWVAAGDTACSVKGVLFTHSHT